MFGYLCVCICVCVLVIQSSSIPIWSPRRHAQNPCLLQQKRHTNNQTKIRRVFM
ncbi:hypothetical protein ACB098_06G133200 [Castanea mollissima]